jgi:hypothetical protein
MLVLSFLTTSDARLKSQVLETKGLVSGVIKGLNEDHEDMVRLVLDILWQDVVKERKIGLEARRNVFEESIVAEVSTWALDALTQQLAHKTALGSISA